ncbi:MAG: cytidylate kinase-like family protein [bacterium]|nr:cytidylate kinase-like family protein [bacterium]
MTSIDAIINRQLLKWELERRRTSEETHPPHAEPHRIITISRQTGSRGSFLATLLAERLGFQRLHREVIDAISKESGYYKRLLEALDEHTRGRLQMAVDAAFSGQMVDHTDYNEYLHKVVLSLAELGGVILMGRGGNLILGPHKGLHVRVVCPDSTRVENLCRYKEISAREAHLLMERTDRDRSAFIHRLFNQEIDDPMQYDLVINTGMLSLESAVSIVETAFHAKMVLLRAHG